MNIYQKIVEIRKEIDVFVKDKKGYNYDYVSGSQVLKKIKSKMDELGVVLEQQLTSQWHEVHKYIKYDKKAQKEVECIDFLVGGEMKMVWVNADEPSDRAEVTWQMLGQQDEISKALGSGLTYSERYFLLKYFGVPTDEDDPDSKPDNKEPDTSKSKKLTEAQVNRAFAIAKSKGYDVTAVKAKVLDKYKKTAVEDLTKQEYDELCNNLETMPPKQKPA